MGYTDFDAALAYLQVFENNLDEAISSIIQSQD